MVEASAFRPSRGPDATRRSAGDTGLGRRVPAAGTARGQGTEAMTAGAPVAALLALAVASPDLVAVLDAGRTLRFLNTAGRAMLGIDDPSRQAAALAELLDASGMTARGAGGTSAAAGLVSWRGETVLRAATRLPVCAVVVAHLAASGQPVFFSITARDASERVRRERRLSRLADRDSLTGLYNRRRFDELLRRTIAESERYRRRGALLYIDLDGFKAVNDGFGHAEGDRLLTAAARRIARRLRTTDLCARLGGDELAVALPQADREQARRVAEDLIAGLAELRGPAGALSASVGVVLFPDHGRDPATLLERADRAMYRAKAARGGRVRFYLPD